uniref:beta strand repeat-containing protein n=1 Tax=Flavobacterium sp. TaxID=239 RepID=UPI0037C10333
MSKNYNFFKFKSFILLVTLLFFSTAFSANWYVNDNSTTGDVYCTAIGNNTNNGTSPATPKLTLGAAITAAAPGDNIFIDTGTYSGTGNINLTVAKANLTFTGAGSLKTIFDNNLASTNTNLWLTITANNINISGISATEFNAVSAGKVITVSGQTVVFNDVNFFNNGNNGNGAIYATSGSNVTFANSTTACNASLLFGGGIDLVGNNSVLNISNSVLATNKKEGNGDGGAVLVKGNGNTITITNTRFEKNDAVNGGAIAIMGGTAAAPNLVNITGCCFENNKVFQTSSITNGGAICVGRGGSTVNVTDCSFTNNSANATGRGGALSVNTGIAGGLSSLTGTATLNLLRCNFSGNNGVNGKHIYGDAVGAAVVNINECTFATAGNFDIEQNTLNEIPFTITNSGSPTVSKVSLTNSTVSLLTAATVCQSFSGTGCTLPAICTAALSYPNPSICSTAATQTPTFSPTGGNFTSTTGLTINASTGVITPSTSTAGTYAVTYTPDALDPTCNATFSITIVAAPSAGTNGTLTVCAGTTPTNAQLFAALNGTPTSGGTWSNVGLVYTYTVTATAPCTTNASATVTVSEQSQPSAGTNGTLNVCAGTTPTNAQLFAALNGTPTSGGTWSNVGLVYTYTVTATAPCTTNASATVTVSEQSQPNAGTNGTLTICAGSTVTATQLFGALGGSPATGGAWTPTLAGAGTYTYTVAATSPCTTAATATVTVSAQAAPNAGTNGTLTICAGSTVTATQLFGALGGSPATGGAWTPT